MRYRICGTRDVLDGQMRLYYLDEIEVMIINLGGQFYSLAGRCTHAGAPLVEGMLEGDILTCPWHGSQFNIADGSVIRGPAAEDLKCYATVVESDYVFIVD